MCRHLPLYQSPHEEEVCVCSALNAEQHTGAVGGIGSGCGGAKAPVLIAAVLLPAGKAREGLPALERPWVCSRGLEQRLHLGQESQGHGILLAQAAAVQVCQHPAVTQYIDDKVRLGACMLQQHSESDHARVANHLQTAGEWPPGSLLADASHLGEQKVACRHWEQGKRPV